MKMVENGSENGKLPPKARRRRRPTTKWSDSKSLYLAIDASSAANSFEIEFLRLSAFQNGAFCRISTSRRPLNSDFESTPQIKRLRRNTAPSAEIYAFGGIWAFGEIQNSLRNCRKVRPAQTFGFFLVFLCLFGFFCVFF